MLNTNSKWPYIVFGILAFVITMIRIVNAGKNTKAVQQKSQGSRAGRKERVQRLLDARGLHEDSRFDGENAFMALDQSARVLVYAVGDQAEAEALPLAEVLSVQVIDHSANYQHCQEMARLRTGVERKSVFLPFGNHSNREVREGSERFSAFAGEMVFGLDFRRMDGQLLTVPCCLGNSSLFWTEENSLTELGGFCRRIEQLL